MGRDRRKYHVSLKNNLYRILTKMFVKNQKKKNYKMTDDYAEKGFAGKIFTDRSFYNYKQHINDYCDWIKDNYPKVTTIKKAKKHVKEYLELQEKTGKSPHTLSLMRASLNKVFFISVGDKEDYVPPKREREKLTRSRGTKESDKNFSRANHEELINFADGTGLRYGGLSKIKGKDLYSLDQLNETLEKYKKEPQSSESRKQIKMIEKALLIANELPEARFFVHTKEKGGKERYAPIVGPHINDIVSRFKNTKDEQKVWLYVPKNADIHAERHKYISYLLKRLSRNIEDIPYDKINKGTGRKYQSEVYHCRKDRKNLKLDAHAMLLTSYAVGHNRIDIISSSYATSI